jgi:signal transduction histidine kinase
MSLEAMLQKVPFLSDMADEEVSRLVDRGRVLSVAAEQTLFREGDQADCMYVILCGQVRIFLQDEDGHESALAMLQTGDFFGEMALLDGGARSASADSVIPCRFFILDRQGFLDLLAASPTCLARLLTALTGNIRKTTDRYFQAELAKQTLRVEMERERHRSLSQMVAGVAHEVNTPLGIINTAASIIKRELMPEAISTLAAEHPLQAVLESVREATDLIQKNITRAHTLVQSFKNMAVGLSTDVKETLHLSEVLVEILDLFKINARKAKLAVEFNTTLTHQESTWVGYRGHLTRVILNLLTNVERYAYPDGVGGKVEIALRAEQQHKEPCFVITVRDSGAGIAPENLPKVFEPFFTTGRGQGGTGLGMAIVYNLVTATLQGTIAIESAPNQGTTVRVTVPQTVSA